VVWCIFVSAFVQNGGKKVIDNLYSILPEGKKQVLIFDTEQSEYDAWQVAKRITKMSGNNTNDFALFGLQGLQCNEIIQLIEYAVSEWANNHGLGVGVVIIDQIADLVNSLNSEEEAKKVINFIEKLVRTMNIHVCCIIHQNKLNDFAQGWLGTQLMKKCETIIKTTKDEMEKNISHVECLDARGTAEFPNFSFKINSDGFPEQVENTLFTQKI